jgi:hypothetical protein
MVIIKYNTMQDIYIVPGARLMENHSYAWNWSEKKMDPV